MNTSLSLFILLLISFSCCAFGKQGYSDQFLQANQELQHKLCHAAKRTIYVDANFSETSETQVTSIMDVELRDGDQILLKGGQRHLGCLAIQGKHQVWVGSYGTAKATLDCKGYPYGILVENSSNIHIHDLNITGDGGVDGTRPMHRAEDEDKNYRYGIYLLSNRGLVENIYLDNINIHQVFYYEKDSPELPKHSRACRHWGAGDFNNFSFGIRGICQRAKEKMTEGVGMKHIRINNCHIEDVSRTGIQFNGSPRARVFDLAVTHCSVKNVGGPGLQLTKVTGGLLSRSLTYRSGSSDDKRKWGRGSGIWTHTCEDILMEYCHFERAEGIADCCGAHIDIDNKDVIIQYCFSKDNAGGFIEILGKNNNCAYRYNISLNDGWRNTRDAKQAELWRDQSKPQGSKIVGANGCLLTVNGHTKDQYVGPYNSYIYNNTIVCEANREDGYKNPYVFEVATSSKNTLIMNNIFWIPAPMSKSWSLHGMKKGKLLNNAVDFRTTTGEYNEKGEPIIRDLNAEELYEMNLVLRNNIYQLYAPKYPMAENILPQNTNFRNSKLGYRDSHAMGGNPQWAKSTQWESPHDFIPRNAKLIEQGQKVEILRGDKSRTGLKPQLELQHDFFGRPLKTRIMGACAPVTQP